MRDKLLIALTVLLLSASASLASTTIDAQVVRNQSGTGETFISSGFPLPPGLVTEDNVINGQITVTVSGSEVAANVTALRGRHSDNTLRSVLIQFTVESMAQDNVLTAQVIVGQTRANPDPAYVRPTLAIVTNNNVILPTSAAYLVTTLVTFQNLLATGGGSAAEENLYTTLADNTFDSLVVSDLMGTASYENVRGMLSMWARSGNQKYQAKAVDQTVTDWLNYNTPAAGQSPPCRNDNVVNPDGRGSGQACALPAEWYGPRMYSYASMYLMTGYRDFWGMVSYYAQWNMNGVTNQSTANTKVITSGAYDLPRYNYSYRYMALIPAMMIDATIDADGQYFLGRQVDWTDQISWVLNAIDNTAWNLEWVPFDTGTGTVPANGTTVSQGGVSAYLAGVYLERNDPKVAVDNTMPTSGYLQIRDRTGGSFSAGALTGISASATGAEETDYRQGMTGTRSDSLRAINLAGDTVIPIFQLAFTTNWLIDYYLYVNSDNTVPAKVKTNLDIILTNIRLMAEGDTYYGANGGAWGNPLYGHPYILENPVNTGDAEPYSLPEYARFLAFAIKTVGDDNVNGATYSTWYSRCINTANISPVGVLTWQWKNFGQFYGLPGQDAPWMMAQDNLVNIGPATAKEPTYYATIPGNTPDIGRDETIPSRSLGSPAGTLAAGTTSTTLSLTTDENATCKYGTVANTAYADIASTFGTTGATSHSQTLSGLANGSTYTYYVRCIDGASNANTNDYTITWGVANPVATTTSSSFSGTPTSFR